MKKTILHILSFVLVTILGTAAFLLIMVLFLAMPDILNWCAEYIGYPTTWALFILFVGGFIAHCISKK